MAIYLMKMRNLFKKPREQDPQPPPVERVPPGDLPEQFEPGRKVKPVEIQQLAELIRKRYELDLGIWGLRDSPVRDRSKIMEKMRRSDATLLKINRTIQSWNRRDIFDSESDWEKFKEIQWRMMEGDKRVWAQDPPWND
ncbi:MAG: hypothetical protein M1840_000055 [Geoglossum simile]|nr:MAG: hypothetical protein M1840_000055 [Geoglossum simile]